mgnify:CR=1 FL=1
MQEPLIGTLFASRLIDPELAPAAIDKAFRLYMLPQGMFAVAVASFLGAAVGAGLLLWLPSEAFDAIVRERLCSRASMTTPVASTGSSGSPMLRANTFADRDGYEVVANTSADWRGVTLPADNPVTADPAMRTALNLAVDREAMVESILAGHGRAASTPVPEVYGVRPPSPCSV